MNSEQLNVAHAAFVHANQASMSEQRIFMALFLIAFIVFVALAATLIVKANIQKNAQDNENAEGDTGFISEAPPATESKPQHAVPVEGNEDAFSAVLLAHAPAPVNPPAKVTEPSHADVGQFDESMFYYDIPEFAPADPRA